MQVFINICGNHTKYIDNPSIKLWSKTFLIAHHLAVLHIFEPLKVSPGWEPCTHKFHGCLLLLLLYLWTVIDHQGMCNFCGRFKMYHNFCWLL